MTLFIVWVTAILIPTARTCTVVQAADPEHTPTIYKEQ